MKILLILGQTEILLKLKIKAVYVWICLNAKEMLNTICMFEIKKYYDYLNLLYLEKDCIKIMHDIK